MSVIDFPTTLQGVGIKWGQHRNDMESRSIFGAQAVEVSGPLWEVMLTPTPEQEADSGPWKALMLKMRGRTNQLALWDLRRPAPIGTMRGSMYLTDPIAQGDVSMNINAVGQGSTTLKQGDPLGFGSGSTQQVVIVTEDSTADANGYITVAFEPPARNAISFGTPVLTGTAQAAAASSLTLAAGASTVADVYKGLVARLMSGNGSVQSRQVLTSRQNRSPYSQAFNSWVKTACTVNSDASLAPDGSLTADDLVEDLTASSSHYINLTYTCIGGFNTVSVHAKQKTGSRCIQLRPSGIGTGIAYANFDLTNGVVGTTGGSSIVSTSMTSLGNGWYRCSLTWNNAGVPTGGHIGMVPLPTSAELALYTGDGASAISVWGHQHEDGALATTYIRTSTLAAVGIGVAQWSSNYSLYSQAFNSWVKTACTVNTDASIAPDGSLTADDLIEDLTTAYRYINLAYTCIGGFDTISVHAKQKTGSRCIQLRPSGIGTGIAYANFDLTNGVVGTTGGSSIVSTSMTSLGNGWYRCSLTWNNAGVPIGGHIGMVPLPTSAELATYTGDGASAISVWGHQHEAGSVVTPYITTTSAAIALPDSTSVYELDNMVPVVWDKPKALFRSQESKASWDYQPGLITQVSGLNLLEDSRP